MLGGPTRWPVCVEGQMAQSMPLPILASHTNQRRGSWAGVERDRRRSWEDTLVFCPYCRMMYHHSRHCVGSWGLGVG